MDTPKEAIIKLIDENEKLFKIICSTHYPFSKQELKTYWDNIIKGNAYYTVYIDDQERYIQPDYGLCWNTNVEWDEWLQNHWAPINDGNPKNSSKKFENQMPIGFGGFYFESYIGLSAHKVPLNIKREVGSFFSSSFSHFLNKEAEWGDYPGKEKELEIYFGKEDLKETRESMAIAKEIIHKNYGELSLDTLSSFLNGNASSYYAEIMITKSEIWEKSISKLIDKDIIKRLFG